MTQSLVSSQTHTLSIKQWLVNYQTVGKVLIPQKNRSMVRGGGKKPWKQKGRGVARAGTIRSPLWKGGGTVFKMEPHSYTKKTTKKMRLLARKSVLSDKIQNKKFIVIDDISLSEPKQSFWQAYFPP